MPGWLWVVIAVALGIVIYLLLRGRGGSGRHRAPAVEYVPALESFERDDEEPGYDWRSRSGRRAAQRRH